VVIRSSEEPLPCSAEETLGEEVEQRRLRLRRGRIVPPPWSRFVLVAPPSLPPFLLSGTVRCDEATGAVACGGWEGLEFGSGLYSPSSSMASKR
jgi:hypothetical protein